MTSTKHIMVMSLCLTISQKPTQQWEQLYCFGPEALLPFLLYVKSINVIKGSKWETCNIFIDPLLFILNM